jgi:ureidoacrylate peracid hydrolase
MHSYQMSANTGDRALLIRGQNTNETSIRADRAALLVIDMQNHFLAKGGQGEIAPARAIVPTVNQFAHSLRTAGGLVVWIQTTSNGALQRWARHHSDTLTAERATSRLASFAPHSTGYALYPGLQVATDDWRIDKIHYSAFIPGSSDLDARLRARAIDTLLIAGTATNVCCDSTARDAAMLNYRTIMIADANATWTDTEHNAALSTFSAYFGDVMTAGELIERIARPEILKSATVR